MTTKAFIEFETIEEALDFYRTMKDLENIYKVIEREKHNEHSIAFQAILRECMYARLCRLLDLWDRRLI